MNTSEREQGSAVGRVVAPELTMTRIGTPLLATASLEAAPPAQAAPPAEPVPAAQPVPAAEPPPLPSVSPADLKLTILGTGLVEARSEPSVVVAPELKMTRMWTGAITSPVQPVPARTTSGPARAVLAEGASAATAPAVVAAPAESSLADAARPAPAAGAAVLRADSGAQPGAATVSDSVLADGAVIPWLAPDREAKSSPTPFVSADPPAEEVAQPIGLSRRRLLQLATIIGVLLLAALAAVALLRGGPAPQRAEVSQPAPTPPASTATPATTPLPPASTATTPELAPPQPAAEAAKVATLEREVKRLSQELGRAAARPKRPAVRKRATGAKPSGERLQIRYSKDKNLIEVWLPGAKADPKVVVKSTGAGAQPAVAPTEPKQPAVAPTESKKTKPKPTKQK